MIIVTIATPCITRSRIWVAFVWGVGNRIIVKSRFLESSPSWELAVGRVVVVDVFAYTTHQGGLVIVVPSYGSWYYFRVYYAYGRVY